MVFVTMLSAVTVDSNVTSKTMFHILVLLDGGTVSRHWQVRVKVKS